MNRQENPFAGAGAAGRNTALNEFLLGPQRVLFRFFRLMTRTSYRFRKSGLVEQKSEQKLNRIANGDADLRVDCDLRGVRGLVFGELADGAALAATEERKPGSLAEREGMKEEETIVQVLVEISRNLERIASALESYNNAAIRGFKTNESDGQIQIVTKTLHRSYGRKSRQ